MKRNTALFGASLIAGVAAAAGLVATGSTSSAATGVYYGVSWADTSAVAGSGGWTTGTYDDNGLFSGNATAGSGSVRFAGGASVTVSVTCTDGEPVTTVVGGGASGVHQAGSTALASDFTGNPNISGTVTFGSTKVGTKAVAGAYIDLSNLLGPGSYVALAGADCTAAPPTTPPTTTPPTSTSTTTPPPTSTTNPPSSTTTNPPTSTPPTTAPPTTEPPTPTPTTTTLPVTG